jgi:hypothetical protein
MSAMQDTNSIMEAQHPSPHRDRVSVPLLFLGLFLGPVAWGLQLITNFALASYRCYPDGAPRTSILPGWQWSSPAILLINVTAAVLALIGAAISYSLWQTVRNEHRGTVGHLVDAGEGRTRFLALWGVMTGLGFLVAILFDTVALSMVPQCAG